MAQSSAEARQEVENARQGLAHELDQLGSSTRAALDIPAKVRRNPARTAGVAGGAAFLLMGGPKRLARAAEARFFPKRVVKRDRALPKDVQKTINKLPAEDREQVEAQLERDFQSYLRKEHAQEPATARQSAWKTYDMFLGIVGAAAARQLVKKLFEVPQETKIEAIEKEGEAVAEAEEKIADAKSGG